MSHPRSARQNMNAAKGTERWQDSNSNNSFSELLPSSESPLRMATCKLPGSVLAIRSFVYIYLMTPRNLYRMVLTFRQGSENDSSSSSPLMLNYRGFHILDFLRQSASLAFVGHQTRSRVKTKRKTTFLQRPWLRTQLRQRWFGVLYQAGYLSYTVLGHGS